MRGGGSGDARPPRCSSRGERAMPEATGDLFRTVIGRRVYDLEQPRTAGMPVHPNHRPGYAYFLYRRHRDAYAPTQRGPRTSASGTAIMVEHTGNLTDALSHQAPDLRLNGARR